MTSDTLNRQFYFQLKSVFSIQTQCCSQYEFDNCMFISKSRKTITKTLSSVPNIMATLLQKFSHKFTSNSSDIRKGSQND